MFKFMNTFQTEVVAESRAMVPDCRNRLKKAVQDLDILLVSLSKQIQRFLKIQITISIELIKERGLFCPWDCVVFIDCSLLSCWFDTNHHGKPQHYLDSFQEDTSLSEAEEYKAAQEIRETVTV